MNLLCPLKVVTFHQIQNIHDYETIRLLCVLPSSKVNHKKGYLWSVDKDSAALDRTPPPTQYSGINGNETHYIEYFETPRRTTL
jgi:hypothetical protein